MPALSLLIIDTNADFRKAAQRFLASSKEIQVVETAGTVQEAQEAAEMIRPDLILIELKILNSYGLSLCHKLKAAMPGVIIIGLTLFSSGLSGPGYWGNRDVEVIFSDVDVIISKDHFAENVEQFMRSININELPFVQKKGEN